MFTNFLLSIKKKKTSRRRKKRKEKYFYCFTVHLVSQDLLNRITDKINKHLYNRTD